MSDEQSPIQQLRPRKPRPEGAHDCPWPGCTGYGRAPFWGCPRHWAGLPLGIQREWTRSDGNPEERRQVGAKIDEWIRRLHDHMHDQAAPVEAAATGFGAEVARNGALTVRRPGLVVTFPPGEAAFLRRVLNEGADLP